MMTPTLLEQTATHRGALWLCGLLVFTSACSSDPEPKNTQTTDTPDMMMEMCVEGSKDCPCYGNGTCDGTLTCDGGTCIESTCPEGSESCLCYGNNTCDGELVCELGRCRNPDAQNMDPDMGEVDPDMCIPMDTCSPGVCGDVDDGCGGVLACGACACEGGLPTQANCGPCDLGRVVCAEGETGAGSCSISPDDPLVAFEEEHGCTWIVHVARDKEPGEPDGSKERPFIQLADATRAANPGSIIVVEQGNYTDQDRVVIDRTVAVVGGFDPAFVKVEGATSSLTMAPVNTPATPFAGIRIEGLQSSGSLVSSLEVLGPEHVHDNTNVFKHSYGASVFNTHDIVFDRCIIRAGKTFIANDGRKGISGENGEPGGDGDRHITDLLIPDPAGDRNGGTPGAGGEHGNLARGICTNSTGGAGGRGGYLSLDSNGGLDYNSPDSGERAQTGAPGGMAGNNAVPSARVGGDGFEGPPGEDGEDGRNGSALASVQPLTGYYDASAGDGTSGTDGTAGGGGGGGGGAWWQGEQTDAPGSSGGGGGAGGCGGEGGAGGTVGSSSFGILALSASVKIIDSTFVAADAQNGGNYGQAGIGGNPGPGGSPALRYLTNSGSPMTLLYNVLGGTGGDGGAGGDGGNGGAGAGGSSFGAYCSAATIVREGDVTLTPGQAGLGGITFDGPRADGLSSEQQGCF